MLGNWEIELIKSLQGLANPVLDWLMLALTELGGQIVIMIVVCLVYWLSSRKRAFTFLSVVFISGLTNTWLKDYFAVTRPYQNGAQSIGSETGGYSFPSGHAQNTATSSTLLYLEYHKKINWLKWILLAVMIIVPLTRMYLGQHYLSDVVVGTILGIMVASIFYWIFTKIESAFDVVIPIIGVITITVFAFGILLDLNISGRNYTYLGMLFGFCLGYFIDQRFIKYEGEKNKTNSWLRAIFGLVVVIFCHLIIEHLAIKIGHWLFLANSLIALMATTITTLLFKLFRI